MQNTIHNRVLSQPSQRAQSAAYENTYPRQRSPILNPNYRNSLLNQSVDETEILDSNSNSNSEPESESEPESDPGSDSQQEDLLDSLDHDTRSAVFRSNHETPNKDVSKPQENHTKQRLYSAQEPPKIAPPSEPRNKNVTYSFQAAKTPITQGPANSSYNITPSVQGNASNISQTFQFKNQNRSQPQSRYQTQNQNNPQQPRNQRPPTSSYNFSHQIPLPPQSFSFSQSQSQSQFQFQFQAQPPPSLSQPPIQSKQQIQFTNSSHSDDYHGEQPQQPQQRPKPPKGLKRFDGASASRKRVGASIDADMVVTGTRHNYHPSVQSMELIGISAPVSKPPVTSMHIYSTFENGASRQKANTSRTQPQKQQKQPFIALSKSSPQNDSVATNSKTVYIDNQSENDSDTRSVDELFDDENDDVIIVERDTPPSENKETSKNTLGKMSFTRSAKMETDAGENLALEAIQEIEALGLDQFTKKRRNGTNSRGINEAYSYSVNSVFPTMDKGHDQDSPKKTGSGSIRENITKMTEISKTLTPTKKEHDYDRDRPYQLITQDRSQHNVSSSVDKLPSLDVDQKELVSKPSKSSKSRTKSDSIIYGPVLFSPSSITTAEVSRTIKPKLKSLKSGDFTLVPSSSSSSSFPSSRVSPSGTSRPPSIKNLPKLQSKSETHLKLPTPTPSAPSSTALVLSKRIPSITKFKTEQSDELEANEPIPEDVSALKLLNVLKGSLPASVSFVFDSANFKAPLNNQKVKKPSIPITESLEPVLDDTNIDTPSPEMSHYLSRSGFTKLSAGNHFTDSVLNSLSQYPQNYIEIPQTQNEFYAKTIPKHHTLVNDEHSYNLYQQSDYSSSSRIYYGDSSDDEEQRISFDEVHHIESLASSDSVFPGFNRNIVVEYDMDGQDLEFLKIINEKRQRELIEKTEDNIDKEKKEQAEKVVISEFEFETAMTLLEVASFNFERRIPPKFSRELDQLASTTSKESLEDHFSLLKSLNGDDFYLDHIANDEFDFISDSEDDGYTDEEWYEGKDGMCSVCTRVDFDDTNQIIYCDGCDTCVHQACYGVQSIPQGQWLCDRCEEKFQRKWKKREELQYAMLENNRANKSETEQVAMTKDFVKDNEIGCLFCPNKGGPFKKTEDGRWAHLSCALWIPAVDIGDRALMEPIIGVENIDNERYDLVCVICKNKVNNHLPSPSQGSTDEKTHGNSANKPTSVCIQCASPKCCRSYHVTCAIRAGFAMELTPLDPSIKLEHSDLPHHSDETLSNRISASASQEGTATRSSSFENGISSEDYTVAKNVKFGKKVISSASKNFVAISYCDRHCPAGFDCKESFRNAMSYYENRASMLASRGGQLIQPDTKEAVPNSALDGLDQNSKLHFSTTLKEDTDTSQDGPETEIGEQQEYEDVLFLRKLHILKNRWKSIRGTPLVPHCVVNHVVMGLKQFNIAKCSRFIEELARYWILKKEHRRGAYLLPRLIDARPETSHILSSFSSNIESTRSRELNYAVGLNDSLIDLSSYNFTSSVLNIDTALRGIKDTELLLQIYNEKYEVLDYWSYIADGVVSAQKRKLDDVNDFIQTWNHFLGCIFSNVIDPAWQWLVKANSKHHYLGYLGSEEILNLSSPSGNSDLDFVEDGIRNTPDLKLVVGAFGAIQEKVDSRCYTSIKEVEVEFAKAVNNYSFVIDSLQDSTLHHMHLGHPFDPSDELEDLFTERNSDDFLRRNQDLYLLKTKCLNSRIKFMAKTKLLMESVFSCALDEEQKLWSDNLQSLARFKPSHRNQSKSFPTNNFGFSAAVESTQLSLPASMSSARPARKKRRLGDYNSNLVIHELMSKVDKRDEKKSATPSSFDV